MSRRREAWHLDGLWTRYLVEVPKMHPLKISKLHHCCKMSIGGVRFSAIHELKRLDGWNIWDYDKVIDIKYLLIFEWCNSTCRLPFNGKEPYPRYATGVLRFSPLALKRWKFRFAIWKCTKRDNEEYYRDRRSEANACRKQHGYVVAIRHSFSCDDTWGWYAGRLK